MSLGARAAHARRPLVFMGRDLASERARSSDVHSEAQAPNQNLNSIESDEWARAERTFRILVAVVVVAVVVVLLFVLASFT